MKNQNSRRSALSRLGSGLALSLAIGAASAPAFAVDPVVFSFATVGDTRQDPVSPDPTQILPPKSATGKLLTQDKIWLQNTRAWARIMRTVQTQKANLFFVNGDMVMGYVDAKVPAAWSTTAPTLAQLTNSDVTQLYTQYAYWRGMVANMMETSTYMMPVPGNHEVECKNSVTQNGVTCPNGDKKALSENEDAWRANMGDLIEDMDSTKMQRFSTVVGLTPSNVHGLQGYTGASAAPTATQTGGSGSDQSDLTYSFDLQPAGSNAILHFAVINTDPTGNDSHAPTAWLQADFDAAAARGTAAGKQVKYFVFGHKMAFTYQYSPGTTLAAGGLDVDAASRNAFWKVIAQYNAAYFCGHEHTTKIDQHTDATGSFPSANPWQVLVGSGGSPFDQKLSGTCPSCVTPVQASPIDRFYAWAVVRVHQSGAVSLDLYGFNDGFGPTQTLTSISNFQ